MSDMGGNEHDVAYNEMARQEMAAEAQVVTKGDRGVGRSVVVVIAIIAVAFVALACIVACAAVASVFLQNAPW